MAASPSNSDRRSASEAVEWKVRCDWEGNGRVWISKECFYGCWDKIWEWIDITFLKDHLMKHGVTTSQDDLFWISSPTKSPKERADNLLYKITPKLGQYGYYLLYMCIRDNRGNKLGHGAAARELVDYARNKNIQAPWETEYLNGTATTPPLTPGTTVQQTPGDEAANNLSLLPTPQTPSTNLSLTSTPNLSLTPTTNLSLTPTPQTPTTNLSQTSTPNLSQTPTTNLSLTPTPQTPTTNLSLSPTTSLSQTPEFVKELGKNGHKSPEEVACAQVPEVVVTPVYESPLPKAVDVIVHNREPLHDPNLEKTVKRNEGKFRRLVRRVFRYLVKTVEDLDEFKVVVTMPTRQNVIFDRTDLQAIQQATTIVEIFIILNQYWNFANYDLLEAMVEEFGDDKLKGEMEVYSRELDAFRERTGLIHFIGVCLCNPRPDSVQVEVHSGGDCSRKTLAYTRQCCICLTRGCGVPGCAFRIHKVGTGSIVLTFLVPPTVVGQIILESGSESMHQAYKKLRVLQLIVGGKTVYNQKEKQLVDIKSTVELLGTKLELSEATRKIKDLEEENESLQLQASMNIYDLNALELLKNDEQLQVEIGNLLERTEEEMQYWELFLQEATLEDISMDALSSSAPREKLMAVLHSWAATVESVSVLMFCKACWRAGAHLAADLLEEKAKETLSSHVHLQVEGFSEQQNV